MQTNRLQYLVYRCTACRRLLTRLDILDNWEASERTGVHLGVCVCGGGRISPSNVTLWEELTTPRIWKLWWKEVVLPRFRR